MHQFGVKSILDYSVEEDMPEDPEEKSTKKTGEQGKEFSEFSPQLINVSMILNNLEVCLMVEDTSSEIGSKRVCMAPELARYQAVDEKAHKQVGRKHKVNSARVHFYQGEANCDKNMDIILQCIDAVTGKNC